MSEHEIPKRNNFCKRGYLNIIGTVIVLVLMSSVVKAQWELMFDHTEQIQDFFFTDENTGYIISNVNYIEWPNTPVSYAMVLKTIDGGDSWVEVWRHSGEPMHFSEIQMTSPDTGYLASFHNGYFALLRTINAGNTWGIVNYEVMFTNGELDAVIAFDDNNRGIFSINGEARLTNNGGASWEELGNEFDGNLSMELENDNFISVAGNEILYSFGIDAPMQSTNLNFQGGLEQIDVKNQEFVASGYGEDGDTFGFPESEYGVIVKGNLQPFENEISLFPDILEVFHITIASSNVFYAVTRPIGLSNGEDVIMKSIDGGLTWSMLESPFNISAKINCLNDSICFLSNHDKLYKTTNGGGPLGEPVNQIPLGVDKVKTSLYDFDIVPNPISTQFSVQSEQQIDRLEVLDVSGRVLFQSVYTENSFVNISTLPSGIYLVRVETIEGSIGVKKLVVK